MIPIIRAAFIAALMGLASTACAADGYGTGTGPDETVVATRDISQPHGTVQGYKTEQEAAEVISKWQKEDAENARKVALSVVACREITQDNTLYDDIPIDKLPPVDQPMQMLSSIFGGMLGLPNMQLVVTEGREAKAENAIQKGYPTRWFRVVDTSDAKRYVLADGRQLVISLALEIVHKQNATKQFANDVNFFIYDPAGIPVMRVGSSELPENVQPKSNEDMLKIIASAAGFPLAEGEREYDLAQLLYKTAALSEIPADK